MTENNSEAGIFPSDPEFPKILEEFKQLEAPNEFPKGSYKGQFLKFYGNGALKTVASGLWLGAEFTGGSECLCTNPSWIAWAMPVDKGTLSFVESVYDSKPCLRIDFKNRFYETRVKAENQLMSIVTFKDSKWISDVNLLTKQ